MNDPTYRNEPARAGLRLLFAGVCLLATSSAWSYEIQKTAEGEPVHWGVTEIRITLDGSLSGLGPTLQVEEAVMAAFEHWVSDAELPIDFTFVRGHCGDLGYQQGGNNENCVMAGSTGQESSHTGAVTRISYSAPSGEIIDGDILFNLDAGLWSLDGEPGTLDVFTVALHEVGHLLGMAHSGVSEARMYPTIAVGDEAGDLHDDDIAGAGYLYAGLEETVEAMTCSATAAGSHHTSPGALLACVLVAVGLLVARRKAR